MRAGQRSGFLGGIIGLVILVAGMVMVAKEQHSSSPPPSLKRCEHRGSHLMGNLKTGKYCEADVK